MRSTVSHSSPTASCPLPPPEYVMRVRDSNLQTESIPSSSELETLSQSPASVMSLRSLSQLDNKSVALTLHRSGS